MANYESELSETVLARSDALVKGDTPRLIAMLADEFTYTNADGMLLSRPEYIENYVESSALKWLAQEITDLRVNVFGETGVATFQVQDRAEYEGQPFEGNFRSLFVYVRRGERWQCVAAQTMRIQREG